MSFFFVYILMRSQDHTPHWTPFKDLSIVFSQYQPISGFLLIRRTYSSSSVFELTTYWQVPIRSHFSWWEFSCKSQREEAGKWENKKRMASWERRPNMNVRLTVNIRHIADSLFSISVFVSVRFYRLTFFFMFISQVFTRRY